MIFGKLFGSGWGKTVERALELEEAGEDGDALILYERALAGERTGVEAGAIRDAEARAVAIRDRIADARIADGKLFLEQDSAESAEEAFRIALQVAGTESKEAEAQACLDAMEGELARMMTGEAREPTQEETFQALSGAWTEDQWDEHEEYGDAFKEAYLAFHTGRPAEAVVIYENLLDEAGQDAVFLLFELGRARAASAVRTGGERAEKLRREAIDALESFNERIPDGVAEGLCAAAWNELAQIHLEVKDEESAEDALMRAQEAVPGESIAYLNLGRFLKQAGRADEAVEALEQGAEVMDKLRPDFRLVAELGLTYRDVGRVDEAMETLQMVVDGMVQLHHGHHDPYVAVPLAEMYEKKGRVREACDLYRHLAEGDDADNLGLYSYHSARLLGELREDEAALRYLARARELAADDDLRKKLDELDGRGQTP
ncbi:MAG: hypothetical protein JRG91_00415 [Deltaproteobacteria bacterium]|nr:hypothetical protein [Deltaproteobacteria bacterium]